MEAVDLLVRACTGAGVMAVAVRAGRIVYIGGDVDELDGAVNGGTTVIDRPGVVLPGFIDTHNHLMLAARNQLGVPVATASNIGELINRIRIRAEGTRVGEWVVTGADWHELALPEQRLPTRTELDAATSKHPVLLQRGGHVGMLNTAGLRAARLSASEPVSGAERDEHGRLTGRVEDQALHIVQALLPPPDPDGLAAALAEASLRYAASGLVAVRDPQSARRSGRPTNASMQKIGSRSAAER